MSVPRSAPAEFLLCRSRYKYFSACCAAFSSLPAYERYEHLASYERFEHLDRLNAPSPLPLVLNQTMKKTDAVGMHCRLYTPGEEMNAHIAL